MLKWYSLVAVHEQSPEICDIHSILVKLTINSPDYRQTISALTAGKHILEVRDWLSRLFYLFI